MSNSGAKRLSSKRYAAAGFHPGNSPDSHVFFSRITMFIACLILYFINKKKSQKEESS
jgi:hypothetical protein